MKKVKLKIEVNGLMVQVKLDEPIDDVILTNINIKIAQLLYESKFCDIGQAQVNTIIVDD